MSRVHRVRNPDGREWDVRAQRLPRPLVRTFHGPDDTIAGLFATLLLGLILPLLVLLVELPFRAAASLFSPRRWVEAICWYPAELTVRWETDVAHARSVQRAVADRLAAGYDVGGIDGAADLGPVEPPPSHE